MSSFAITLTLVAALMHAAWNLLAHAEQQDRYLLIRLPLVFGLAGIVPLAVFECLDPTLTHRALQMLPVAVVCQAIYFVGLTMGYRLGEFTVVYPLARALPILMLAVVDLACGRPPTLAGWFGILLVTVACSLLGIQAMRCAPRDRFSTVWIWIVLTAMSTFGYSAADKLALESMPRGLDPAFRYCVLEFSLSALVAGAFLGASPISLLRSYPPASWKKVMLGAGLIGGSYGVILRVYQLVDQVSYVVAARQMSIVIGVALAAWVSHEHVNMQRIVLSIVIATGVALIAIA